VTGRTSGEKKSRKTKRECFLSVSVESKAGEDSRGVDNGPQFGNGSRHEMVYATSLGKALGGKQGNLRDRRGENGYWERGKEERSLIPSGEGQSGKKSSTRRGSKILGGV